MKMVRVFGETVKSTKFDPSIWQKIVQPTYAWGIDFGEGRLTGPSGMQVGSIQGISILLGVEAKSDIGALTLATQQYFTPPQQLFLELLMDKSDVIRNFAHHSKDERIIEYYNDCIHELARWRHSHMKRAAMYLERAGTEVNNSRISTGLTLAASENQKQVFEEDMTRRIEETRYSMIPQRQSRIPFEPFA